MDEENYGRIMGITIAFWNRMLKKMGATEDNAWMVKSAAILAPNVTAHSNFSDTANMDRFWTAENRTDIDFSITWDPTTGETKLNEEPWKPTPIPEEEPWWVKNQYIPESCNLR